MDTRAASKTGRTEHRRQPSKSGFTDYSGGWINPPRPCPENHKSSGDSLATSSGVVESVRPRSSPENMMQLFPIQTTEQPFVLPAYLALSPLPVHLLHYLLGYEGVGLQSEVALLEILEPLSHQEADREVPVRDRKAGGKSPRSRHKERLGKCLISAAWTFMPLRGHSMLRNESEEQSPYLKRRHNVW